MTFMKILCGDISSFDEVKISLSEVVRIMPGITKLMEKYLELTAS